MITKTNVEAFFEPDVIEEIIQGTIKNSVAMQVMRKLPNMTTDMMKMRVLDALPVAYWVGSDNNGRKKLTKMAWDKKFIVAEELAVIVPIKENTLNDTDINLWEEIKPRIFEAFGKAFDQAVFSGVNKPAGFRADLLTSIKQAGANISQGQNETLYSAIDRAMAKVEESDYEPNALLGGLNLKSKFRNMLDTTGQPLNQTEIGSLNRYFVANGSWDKDKALMIVGDFTQAVYAIRQDITYKILDQAVIQDPSTGDILYNLAQEDMVALRCVMRLGWEIPNPINAEQPDESIRFPFAAIEGATPITTQNVTFTVSNGKATTDSDYAVIANAKVKIGGLSKKTDNNGQAVFKLQTGSYDYVVEKEGYITAYGKATVNASAVAVTVVLQAK